MINIGPEMSAHVLLHLLNKLRERDKMRGFHKKFNKFYNTGAQMLDSYII